MTKEEMRENIRKNLINLRILHGMNQTEVGKKVNKVKTVIDALIDRIEIDGDDLTIYWKFS